MYEHSTPSRRVRVPAGSGPLSWPAPLVPVPSKPAELPPGAVPTVAPRLRPHAGACPGPIAVSWVSVQSTTRSIEIADCGPVDGISSSRPTPAFCWRIAGRVVDLERVGAAAVGLGDARVDVADLPGVVVVPPRRLRRRRAGTPRARRTRTSDRCRPSPRPRPARPAGGQDGGSDDRGLRTQARWLLHDDDFLVLLLMCLMAGRPGPPGSRLEVELTARPCGREGGGGLPRLGPLGPAART